MTTTQSDRADEISALLETGTTLLETLDVSRVLQLICDHAVKLLSASGSAIAQYDETTDQFVLKVTAGSLVEAQGSRFGAEGSLSGISLETRRPLLENSIPDSSARNAAGSLPVPIHRAVVAPLIGRGRVLGTLSCIKGSEEEPFTESDMKVLMAFANQAALAVLNAQVYQDQLKRAQTLDVLHDRLEEQIRQLHSLHRAGLTVTSDLDLDDLLERVVEEGCRLTRARYGALGVLNDEGNALESFITVGLTLEQRARMGDLPSGHGLLGAVIREGEPIRVKNARHDDRSAGVPRHHPDISSFLGVPIRIREKVYGNLYLTNKQGQGEFTDDDQTVLEMLASYAAVAIENARLFREREKLIHELEAAQKARNRLHAYVNHDIRNALHGVTLWAERLERRSRGREDGAAQAQPVTPPEQVDIAGKIRRGSEHALRLVTDVLDLAKIDEGRFQTWPRRVNMVDLIQAARDTIAPEAEIREVSVDLAPVEDRIHLVADPDRVLQVTLNLLSNAVKFSPAGGAVTVALERVETPAESTDGGPGREAAETPDGEALEGDVGEGESESPPTGWVVVSVSDEGPGIHPEDLERIFSEFEQLDSAAQARGTGLGLTLCRNLAHHMGGDILVDSTPGKGSTFSLRLPMKQEYAGREGWIG